MFPFDVKFRCQKKMSRAVLRIVKIVELEFYNSALITPDYSQKKLRVNGYQLGRRNKQ